MKNNNKKSNVFTKTFGKVRDYIKNTAWIQPLLIVVVIFLVLFLLNPIKNGISDLWNNITTYSKMETITFEEYTQKIEAAKDKEDSKILVVFIANDCDHCDAMYPVMNKYIKERTYGFEIYSVNLSTKTKNNGDVIYKKDKTAGYASGNATNDATYALDERIQDWNESVNTDTSLLTEVTYDDDWTGYKYTYLSTPLFVWYINGSEVKICNTFDSKVSTNSDGDKDYESFKSFISFKGLSVDEDWANDYEFNLEAKNR